MQAIILAAGVGSRLQALSDGKPKCLVEIGGRPLILHTLEALADHGVGPVHCILGYCADDVRAVIGDRADVIINERYEATNSLYSLWLARNHVSGPFLLLNADLYFDPRILDALLDEDGNVLAFDSTSSRGREQTKVAIRKRRVVDLGKDVPVAAARGESLGMLQFDETGGQALFRIADDLIRDGHEDAWVIEATRALCRQVSVYGVNIAGHAWTEIDFPYDLDVARREVWPAIYRNRWRYIVGWKRLRWAAAAFLLLTVASMGWAANSTVGPASIDWESIPPDEGALVRITQDDSRQRWWQVERGETVTATVEGPQVQVQVRLLLPDSVLPPTYYVVEVALDGTPVEWRAFSSRLDPSVIEPAGVGDRDRLYIDVPPGSHVIGVRLVEGHSDRMLVRLRQPERDED